MAGETAVVDSVSSTLAKTNIGKHMNLSMRKSVFGVSD